jgi:hypothetical protein
MCTFPSTLLHLELGSRYRKILVKGTLPECLQTLKLRCQFLQDVDVLPPNLQELWLFSSCTLGGPIYVPIVRFADDMFRYGKTCFHGEHKRQIVHVKPHSALRDFAIENKDMWIHLEAVLNSIKHNKRLKTQ